jgi:DNA-binding NtrC family response regulator
MLTPPHPCTSVLRPSSPAIVPCALAERKNVKDQLESLVGFMVERGILLEEAVTEFEKKFIRRVLEKLNGNQSRAAKVLGMHRNTLSRKIGAYKLDQVGRRHR